MAVERSIANLAWVARLLEGQHEEVLEAGPEVVVVLLPEVLAELVMEHTARLQV